MVNPAVIKPSALWTIISRFNHIQRLCNQRRNVYSSHIFFVLFTRLYQKVYSYKSLTFGIRSVRILLLEFLSQRFTVLFFSPDLKSCLLTIKCIVRKLCFSNQSDTCNKIRYECDRSNLRKRPAIPIFFLTQLPRRNTTGRVPLLFKI